MLNGQNSCERLRKAERLVRTIAARRRNNVRQGNSANRKRSTQRPARRQNVLGTRAELRSRSVASSSTNNFKHAVAHSDHQVYTKTEYNNMKSRLFSDNVPIRKNVSEKAEIHPPIQTSGYDEHGHYVEIIGTEAITAIKVFTTADPLATQAGNMVLALSLAPQQLPSTRAYLLSKIYEKYLPIEARISYIPQVSATQDGALCFIPVTDPADSFVFQGERASIIRSMGYEGAIQTNVYNPITVGIPGLDVIDDPLFCQGGSDERLENATLLYVMAQSAFSPTAANVEVTLGWLKLHYCYRFYNPVATPVIDNYLEFFPSGGVLWTAAFNTTVVVDGILLGKPATFLQIGATPIPRQGYYSAICQETVTNDASPVEFYTDTHDAFTITAGTVLWYKMSEADTNNPFVEFFLSPEDAVAGVNTIRYVDAIVPGTAAFQFHVTYFDTSQNL